MRTGGCGTLLERGAARPPARPQLLLLCFDVLPPGPGGFPLRCGRRQGACGWGRQALCSVGWFMCRRVYCFGMSLLKLDIRQESTRHADAMDAITTYLGYGR